MSEYEDIEDILREVREELNAKNSFLTRNRKEIDVVFQDKETVEDIIETLSNFGTEFGLKTTELLTKMSPITLKVTLESLSWGDEIGYQRLSQMEYRMAQKIMTEGSNFYEGVRDC